MLQHIINGMAAEANARREREGKAFFNHCAAISSRAPIPAFEPIPEPADHPRTINFIRGRRGYRVLHKAGPLRNGYERGSGTIFHAIPERPGIVTMDRALCGAQPSIQWSDWNETEVEVTCPRCLRKLAVRS